MSGKPLSHEEKKENGFKKPDRVDRHPRENQNSPQKPVNKDNEHKPKIVPWK